jgi:hypothetical protein
MLLIQQQPGTNKQEIDKTIAINSNKKIKECIVVRYGMASK